MLRRFAEALQGLLPDGPEAVLAGVSGGADSMALATLLRLSGRPFAVAHCNFSLRGEESDGDQAFVERWCAEAGVPCYVKRFDTQAFARERGISIEMAARELRYGWFDTLDGFGTVAVAHNANDNAETLLLNLLRGTGLRGLCGMKPSSALPVPLSRKRLVRPLLWATRAEIEAFLREQGVTWREDRSNAEEEALRNRIRHGVFPQLAAVNPSFVQVLGRDMAHFSEALSVLDDYVSEYDFLVRDGDPVVIDVEGLLRMPRWPYLLYRFLEPYGFSETVLRQLRAALSAYGTETFSGKEFYSPRYRLVTAAGRLEIASRTLPPPLPGTQVIRGPGRYQIGGQTVEVEVFDKSDGMELRQPEGQLIADAEALPMPFLIRRPQEGDWMVPLGMRGRKRLSDLFTDLKCSLLDKERLLVAVVPGWPQGRVAALLGRRIDARLRVGEASARVVKIKISRNT